MDDADTNNGLLKVAVIEDSPLLLRAMGALLGALDRVQVVGDAADEHAAIELLQLQRPDLAIVDLQLQTGSGFGVLKAVSRDPEHFGRPRTVVFSHHTQTAVRQRCFDLGAERFFDKATQMSELIAYVRQSVPS
jgi:DNA-binding NarL/FixJ family response regulator